MGELGGTQNEEHGRIHVESISIKAGDKSSMILLLFGMTTSMFAVCSILGSASLRQFELSDVESRFFFDLIFVAFVFVWLVVLRIAATPLATNAGMIGVFVVAVIGTVIVPLFLVDQWWLLRIILFSAGIVSLVFLWWSHACTMGRDNLMTVLSGAALITAILLIVANALPLSHVQIEYMGQIASLASCMLLLVAKNARRDELLTISVAESRAHTRDIGSSRVGRLNYFSIGFILGIDAGLWLLTERLGEQSPYGTPLLMLGVAFLVTGAMLLFCRLVPSFDAERITKDYLSASLALGYLLFPMVSGIVLSVTNGYLVVVALFQVFIIFLAGVEQVRFEELSPLYSFSHASFIIGGMFVGAVLCVAAGEVIPDIAITVMCGIVLLYMMLVQVQLNKITFPEDWVDSKSASLPAQPLIHEGMRFDQEHPRSDGLDGAEISLDEKFIPAGSYLRMRLDAIAETFKLSPRQKEILDLLARGRDTQYVMETFTISRATAKTHIYNIYRKLDIHSRQELYDLIENDGVDKH